MIARSTAVAVALSLLSACAGEPRPVVAGYIAERADGASSSAVSENDLALAKRKSLAGKVLAALALERVTGRKPDPAHFARP